EGQDAAVARGALGIGVEAEGPAAALQLEGVASDGEDLVAFAGATAPGAEVEGEGEGADGTVEAETLEEGLGHEQLAGGRGVEAVPAERGVVPTQGGLGLGQSGRHGVVDVGEGQALFLGELTSDVAEAGQGLVVDVSVEAGEVVG